MCIFLLEILAGVLAYIYYQQVMSNLLLKMIHELNSSCFIQCNDWCKLKVTFHLKLIFTGVNVCLPPRWFQLSEELKSNLKNTLVNKYKQPEQNHITEAVDKLQQEVIIIIIIIIILSYSRCLRTFVMVPFVLFPFVSV